MGALPKEVIHEILSENKLNNAGEVMSFLKDAFKCFWYNDNRVFQNLKNPAVTAVSSCLAIDGNFCPPLPKALPAESKVDQPAFSK